MKYFWTRLREILWRRDIEYAEFQGAFIAILWGIWFLHPYQVGFLSGVKVVAPVIIVAYSTQWHSAWGFLFVTIGSIQVLGLVTHHYRIRRTGAMLGMMAWLFVALLLALGDWRALSCPTTFAFSLGSAWGFIRIRQYEEDAKREIISGSKNRSETCTTEAPAKIQRPLRYHAT